MTEAHAALDAYRDAVELRARYEAAFCSRSDRPSPIKLAAMRADERRAREALETSFALALSSLDPGSPGHPHCACGEPLLFSARQRGDGMCGPCSRASVPG